MGVKPEPPKSDRARIVGYLSFLEGLLAYFTERERGAKPRTIEEVTPAAWLGLAAAITARMDNGSFGDSYPDQCPDGRGPVGTNTELMRQAVGGYFPELRWPPRADELPADPFQALDLVEFCYEKVAKPNSRGYHDYFGHDHLEFDVDAGREEFRTEVNRIFERNGLVFHLEQNGQVVRLAPTVLAVALQSAVFKTGDDILDRLLETAPTKFLSLNLTARKESLEKLWDAFERLKTLEDPDKKSQLPNCLRKASRKRI